MIDPLEIQIVHPPRSRVDEKVMPSLALAASSCAVAAAALIERKLASISLGQLGSSGFFLLGPGHCDVRAHYLPGLLHLLAH